MVVKHISKEIHPKKRTLCFIFIQTSLEKIFPLTTLLSVRSYYCPIQQYVGLRINWCAIALPGSFR